MRYFYGFIWFIVISFATSLILNMGIMAYLHFSGAIDIGNPPPGADGFAFGQSLGKLTNPISFLVGLISAIVGTSKEKLPGTKRKVEVKRAPIKYDHPH